MNVIGCPARSAPRLFACAAMCAAMITTANAARAQDIGRAQNISTEIDGRVIDAQTGLPLAGAAVSVGGGPVQVISDAHGGFRVLGLPPGVYALSISRSGYQPSEADSVTLTAGTAANVTLALQAAPTGARLTTIGRSATTLGGALQKASTSYRSLDPEALIESGTYRAGDALRGLPGVNNGITGDTAALGDDLQLDFRGIGTLETLAMLDGHPIAYGVPGGYNYQLSPVAGLRNINVIYGSSSNLAGYSAIGGSVDFQTLEPTPDQRVTVSQGYGTYSKASTQLQATGTIDRLDYAFAYGVGSLDGPLKNDFQYQPGAAFDQSAVAPGADPAVRALAVYKDDSLAVSRSGLAKLRYALSATTDLTLTSVVSSYWNDKTGNGDGDYTPYALALAQGEGNLAGYSPAAFPQLAPCPAGTFVATNANGQPNGYGPPPKGSAPGTLGPRDGGITCQTPQQYAAFNTGYDGAGTAWQAFNFGDYHLGLRSAPRNQIVRVDAFTNRYLDTISRQDALPFVSAPGDSTQAFYARDNVAEAGVSASDTFVGRDNDIGLGYTYLNTSYNLSFATPTSAAAGTPIVNEAGFVLHDIYHPHGGALTAYFDGTLKRSTATNTSNVDPRASMVYSVTSRDVARFSAGATTTQPSGDELDQPFVPSPPGGAGGGAGINCVSNSIGSAPSSVLKPERGVDAEIAYGHRFRDDSQVQLTLYNVNIYDKLFSTTIPLSQSGTGFIDPVYLAEATAAIAKSCPNAAATLAVTGTFNVGQERARGAMLGGRQRLTPRTFIDYDWTLDSTALVSAPVPLLQANVTLVPGAQLAHLPLHTFAGALDQVVGRGVDLRYTVHAFSAGNTKSLPAYNYSDLRASVPIGRGLFAVTVSNLFNQWANIEGLRGEGVPLALNAYATPANYAPLVGNAATEQFGLPNRGIFFNYALFTR
jgi:outer membrane receptor protein involved in Fe transport